MAFRQWLQSRVLTAWQKQGLLAQLLRPLSWLYGAWRMQERWHTVRGEARKRLLPVPVVVIGNLYIGGTGKTPLTMTLVKALRKRGWTPGVVSRGYKSRATAPRVVLPTGKADEFGDEPLLLAQATGAPVVVGRNRLAAARLLLNLHPRTDIILADDGLQHKGLPRDLEIALVHHRGFGNGLLLPAGPLRDPPQRLAQVDAVVFHDQPDMPRPAIRVYSPFFSMRTGPGPIYALKDPERVVNLSELASEQTRHKLHVIAMCGIGAPERFFAMLQAHGLVFDRIALPDHYEFHDNPLAGRAFDVALITEKDAVKCRANPVLASDGRLCVVPLATTIDPGLIDLIEARVRHASSPAPEEFLEHGPSPA